MSAIVLGKRSSSFFEELPSPPSASKRIRCSSSGSPSRFSPPRSAPADGLDLLANLRSLFPGMDDQLLQRALEASTNDLDSAIRSLNELRLRQAEDTLKPAANQSISEIYAHEGLEGAEQNRDSSTHNLPCEDDIQASGADWVELFVSEMMHASNIDDARARVSKALQMLEQNIMARASAGAAQALHKENLMRKEQLEVLMRENGILKRAVAIQHERHKEYDEKNQELLHLKQLVAEYQEQVKKLEMSNYALMVHLRQAQQSSSIPGQFHPDVF